MLDFAQCMREHGVDMEDPTTDENGNFQMMRPSGGGEGGEFDPEDREAMQAAREACSQYLEGIAQQFDRPDMTEMQDLMLEYAACMRENGVDMPDPDFSTPAKRAARAPAPAWASTRATTTPTTPSSRRPTRPARRSSGPTACPA